MSVRIETENGYEIEFLKGLERSDLDAIDDPREFESERLVAPFALRGEPGLVDVRMQFEHVDDTSDDVYNFDFSATLRPAGLFTNFRSSVNELRSEATIPARLFPVRVRSVQVRNLSDEYFGDRRRSAKEAPSKAHSPTPRVDAARVDAAQVDAAQVDAASPDSSSSDGERS